MAQSIYNFFRDEYNLSEIESLFLQGVVINEMKVSLENNEFIAGKTFVITGTLSSPREEFEKIIDENGGKVTGSVSKKTDYLLVGENAGSKFEKAKSLDVKVLTEREFMAMIKK